MTTSALVLSALFVHLYLCFCLLLLLRPPLSVEGGWGMISQALMPLAPAPAFYSTWGRAITKASWTKVLWQSYLEQEVWWDTVSVHLMYNHYPHLDLLEHGRLSHCCILSVVWTLHCTCGRQEVLGSGEGSAMGRVERPRSLHPQQSLDKTLQRK